MVAYRDIFVRTVRVARIPEGALPPFRGGSIAAQPSGNLTGTLMLPPRTAGFVALCISLPKKACGQMFRCQARGSADYRNVCKTERGFEMQEFNAFFDSATGRAPHGYQARIARDGLPDVIQAATGTGKTGVILAWLWRRLHGDPEGTARRLVYALPQRSLVEQVAGEVGRWLANLGLADQVALHVVMGGAGESQRQQQRQWRLDMHKPAIVVGTVDSLVSKALNRGYGIGRASYPIDFALVTNGAHWVIDEIQLCQESTTTLRQLAAFAKAVGTAEPFGLTCMSATVPEGLLETVDNPVRGDVVGILPGERTRELAMRLDATRTIRRLVAEPGDYKAIATIARDRHRPGTLTLVVLNTVDAARTVYKTLRGGPTECTLLHS